jgi:hypothetical protein
MYLGRCKHSPFLVLFEPLSWVTQVMIHPVDSKILHLQGLIWAPVSHPEKDIGRFAGN